MPLNNGSLTSSSGEVYHSLYTKCSSGACLSLHVNAQTKTISSHSEQLGREIRRNLMKPRKAPILELQRYCRHKTPREHPDDHVHTLPLRMEAQQQLLVPANNYFRAQAVCPISNAEPDIIKPRTMSSHAYYSAFLAQIIVW
jgi:hypothetical protein